MNRRVGTTRNRLHLLWLAISAGLLLALGACAGETDADLGGMSSHHVASFILINADTDQPIPGFDPITEGAVIDYGVIGTQNLNFRADTVPATVGSVGFDLGGVLVQTENGHPYALAGNSGADYLPISPALAPGDHTLTATPYSERNLGGTAGQSLTLNFSVAEENEPPPPPPPPPPTGTFSLIDADNDVVVPGYDPIPAGATLDLAALPTRNLNIRANLDPGSAVSFYLDGAFIRKENSAPFAAFGDKSGDYKPWTPDPGSYTMRADQNGSAAAQLNFDVVDGGTPPPDQNAAPTAGAGADQTLTLPDDTADLLGSANDDGLPDPPGALTFTWSGPAGVVFGDPTALATTATFPGEGVYTLTLTADDSELTASDTLAVTVKAEPPPPPPPPPPSPDADTAVSIQGERWYLNDSLTNAGTAAEGLLLNARMVNVTFEDRNPETAGTWFYPDGTPYDPDRQTDEFVAMVPTYAARGLNAISINLQGGKPAKSSAGQPWINSPYTADGSLRPAHMARVGRVIEALDNHGMVVILGLFYQAQDEHLANEAAVNNAVDGVVDWVLAQGYTNVVLEVTNEAGHSGFDHDIFTEPRIDELILRARQRSGGSLLISASLMGGKIPRSDLREDSDYLLLHGNGKTATEVGQMVDTVRGFGDFQADPRPIVFNEDSTSLANMDAAISRGASWGFHYKGKGDYATGFQFVPTNWTINDALKQAFFDEVERLTQ